MRNSQRLAWRDMRDEEMGLTATEDAPVAEEPVVDPVPEPALTEAQLLRKSKDELVSMLTKADLAAAIVAKAETESGV